MGRGRFWSQDSFEGHNEEPLSLHKYLYGHGNPVNNIDPTGFENLTTQSVKVGFITRIGTTFAQLFRKVITFGRATRIPNPRVVSVYVGFRIDTITPHFFLYAEVDAIGSGIKYDVGDSPLPGFVEAEQVIGRQFFAPGKGRYKVFGQPIARLTIGQAIIFTASVVGIPADLTTVDIDAFIDYIGGKSIEFSYLAPFVKGSVNCFTWTLAAASIAIGLEKTPF